MSNPNFPIDGQSERIDALVDASAAVYLKLAVGSKAVTGATQAAAWHGAATHADGATFATSDGVSLAAGITGTTVKKMLVDTTGALINVGAGASGSATVGAPVRVGGSDGTNTRDLSTDASGHAQIVEGRVTDGAGTYVTVRNPNIFKTASATASGNTAVWTPTSGKKFRLMRFCLQVTANASQTTGGVVTIKFQDATTDIGLAFDVFIPTTAVTTTAGDAFVSPWIDLGNGYLSSAANNVLNVNLGSALANGTCRVLATGTEE